MKPITEQRWQEIIADCEKLIEHTEHLLLSADLSIGWRKAHENNLLKHQIALASLTAVPFACIHPNMLDDMDGGRISGRVWNSPVDEMSGEERLPVYTAPPVPVIKFPNVNLRISGLLIMEEWPTREWCFMEGARWMVGKINELNKLEG